MIDAVKKVLYAGIGVFALSEDKTKEIIKELVQQGEITAQDGEKLVADVAEKCKAKGKSVEESVAGKIKEYFNIQGLESRVAALEKEVEELKKK